MVTPGVTVPVTDYIRVAGNRVRAPTQIRDAGLVDQQPCRRCRTPWS